jgi:hypothetical protein
MRVALGFRVKSGYAIAVVLRGTVSAPEVVARHVVQLSDPHVADTKQPYHDGFGTHEEDPRKIARRVQIVERCAEQSVTALVEEVRRAPRHGRVRAALVVGSVIDPAQVGNPHIRAHANEGRVFRTVLESALQAHGIDCDVIVEKQLAEKAAQGLHCPDAEIKRTLAAFGKTLGGSWRAEEKAACTAAWLALGHRRLFTKDRSNAKSPT